MTTSKLSIQQENKKCICACYFEFSALDFFNHKINEWEFLVGSYRLKINFFFVIRLRQEIAHPAGVRLTLRKRDCQNSLALVDIFGCLWVAGWKQRDFPILFNAFHVGDQILSVAGQPVRTASDFNKLVKSKTSNSGPNPGMFYTRFIISLYFRMTLLAF